MQDATHPNLSIMKSLDINNLDDCSEIFADHFVWHYFNPKLPEIQKEHLGVSGLKEFFSKMNIACNGKLQVNPVEAFPIGDELVVVHACNRLVPGDGADGTIEFDAVVVWRIVDGKITEAWDIPGVHNIRHVQSGQNDHDLESC